MAAAWSTLLMDNEFLLSARREKVWLRGQPHRARASRRIGIVADVDEGQPCGSAGKSYSPRAHSRVTDRPSGAIGAVRYSRPPNRERSKRNGRAAVDHDNSTSRCPSPVPLIRFVLDERRAHPEVEERVMRLAARTTDKGRDHSRPLFRFSAWRGTRSAATSRA
jgi:hypothetical protein